MGDDTDLDEIRGGVEEDSSDEEENQKEVEIPKASEEQPPEQQPEQQPAFKLMPVTNRDSDQSNTAPKPMYIEEVDYTYTVGRNPFTGIMNALLSRELLKLSIVCSDGEDSLAYILMKANRVPNKICVNGKMDYSEKGARNEAMLFPGDVLTLYDDKYSYSVSLFDKSVPEKSESNYDSSNKEKSRRPSSNNMSSPKPNVSQPRRESASGSQGPGPDNGSDRKSSTAKIADETTEHNKIIISETVAAKKAEERETIRKAKWGLLVCGVFLITLFFFLLSTRDTEKAPQTTATRMLRGGGAVADEGGGASKSVFGGCSGNF